MITQIFLRLKGKTCGRRTVARFSSLLRKPSTSYDLIGEKLLYCVLFPNVAHVSGLRPRGPRLKRNTFRRLQNSSNGTVATRIVPLWHRPLASTTFRRT